MSADEGNSLYRMFSGLLSGIIGDEGDVPKEPARNKEQNLSDPAKLLDGALAVLQKRKDELKRQSDQLFSGAENPTAAAQTTEQLIDEVHQNIRKDIVALHKKLGSGLDEPELRRSHALLLELDKIMAGRGGAGCENRLRAAVIKFVFSRCTKPAWSALEALMKRADINWPVRSVLPPWAKEAEVAASNARTVSEIADAFLTSTPSRAADRMIGIVAAWRANYPDPHSPEWQQLVLQGVGYGILAHIVCEASRVLRHEAEAVKGEAIKLMASEAGSVQAALEAGLSSPHDVDKILGQVSELCEEVIPELAWKSVEPVVNSAVLGITA